MAKPAASGRHDYWYEGDLFGVRFRGSITRQDMEELRDAMQWVAEDHPRSYLMVDLTDSTGIEPEARKYMARWSRERSGGLIATVVYGVGFAMRAIVTLTLNAVRLLGQLNSEVQFVKDEAEARRWVLEHRARSSGDAHVGR